MNTFKGMKRFALMATIVLLFWLPEGVLAADPANPKEQHLDAKGLLAKLREMDARYRAAFTATGTFVAPALRDEEDVASKVRWKITMGNGRIAYQRDLVEVLKWKDVFGPDKVRPSQRLLGGAPLGGDLLEVRMLILVRDKDYVVYESHGMPPYGPVKPWSHGAPEPAPAGRLGVYPLYAPGHLGMIDETMEFLGRWYATSLLSPNHITKITDISYTDGGLISFAAEGWNYEREPYRQRLKWNILVDPKASYMVRSAKMHVVGDDNRDTETTNKGLRSGGILCAPEEIGFVTTNGKVSELGGIDEHVTSVSSKVDLEFLRAAESTIHGPFPSHTDFEDERGKDGIRAFKAGESWVEE